MNRQIIFRGRRLDNGEWVYGNLFQGILDGMNYALILDNTRTVVDNEKTTENTPLVFDKDEVNPVNPNTVGQYTGVNDVEVKPAYDGDIVRAIVGSIAGIYQIVFINGAYRLADKDGDVWYNLEDCCFKILGNIYDNPELLEED